MPRRGQPGSLRGEEYLAQRVQLEREKAGLTFDGLAKRMTEAGCPLNASALFKIEKASPRRRITVDELVAFSRVFKLPMEELVTDPALSQERELKALILKREKAEAEAEALDAAINRRQQQILQARRAGLLPDSTPDSDGSPSADLARQTADRPARRSRRPTRDDSEEPTA